MALALVRRLSRFTWLRLLVSLAIYMLAVPGTVRSTTFVSANAANANAKTSATDAAAPVDHAAAKSRRRAIVDDEVRVFYCTTCGFEQNFQEIKTFLEQRYPHLVDRVYGANYEVDSKKKLLAKALGVVQLVAMVLMVLGDYIFRTVGLDTTLLQKALDNRIACFAVIILLGSLSQSLVSTGAFEITLNGDLVFSKLQVGRWPTLEELAELFDARGLQGLAT